MHRLYVDLKDFINQRFPNGINFLPDERIVFIHNDLDFYINDSVPGFTLYNLQLILRELDIPNFFCAVVSNMPNYTKYTKMVRDLLCDDVPLRGISSFYGADVINLSTSINQNVSTNVDQIAFPFVSLSRVGRFNRTFFTAKLFEKNLQTQGLVSYHNIPGKQDISADEANNQYATASELVSPFLYAQPFNRCNTEIKLHNERNRFLVKQFQEQVKTYQNFKDQNDINNKHTSMSFHNSVIQQALVFVGLETAVVYPEPYLSSISFKGIAEKRPFIISGAPGVLSYLRDLGFKTFDRWWDEKYDSEPNFEDRTDLIINILDQLSKCSRTQLQTMCAEMSSILEHNFYHLTNTFITQEKEKIDLALGQQFM